MKIDSITPKIILDSRRERTIETILTSGKFEAKASIPCGKSKGDFEAFCHTVEHSSEIIKELTPNLVSKDFRDQKEFDEHLLELDGTDNKSKLGVNVTLSLSIAFCRLFSLTNGLEVYKTISEIIGEKPKKFPMLFFNLINGGLHVEKSFCPLPFQEYMLIPKSTSPKESLDLTFTFIDLLKKNLESKGLSINYGDEGGLIIKGDNPELGLEHLQEILNSNSALVDNVYFGLDVASSSLWRNDQKDYGWENEEFKCSWTEEQLSTIYESLANKYPLLSIEDPFNQESWEDWSKLNKEIGDKVWIVGDDLTVTNVKRIQKAKEFDAINTVLIKPNQIGTITETLNAVKLTKQFGWKIIVSHRSGETNDTFISDLAFGVNADGLKSGSPLQDERLIKYKRLLEIEESFGR